MNMSTSSYRLNSSLAVLLTRVYLTIMFQFLEDTSHRLLMHIHTVHRIWYYCI